MAPRKLTLNQEFHLIVDTLRDFPGRPALTFEQLNDACDHVCDGVAVGAGKVLR